MRAPLTTQILACGGIVGPAAFVTGWVVLGLRISPYSFNTDAISEIARSGRATHTWMTLAFVAYALGILGFAAAAQRNSHRRWWIAVAVNALATLGVASAPLGRADTLHFLSAAAAYVSLAVFIFWASAEFRPRSRYASVFMALLVAMSLLFSVIGPLSVHGLLQRVGLTLGDAWIVWVSFKMLKHDR